MDSDEVDDTLMMMLWGGVVNNLLSLFLAVQGKLDAGKLEKCMLVHWLPTHRES